ncbi:hypothetical protein Tco_1079667 [Tanacetum coccineum]|uniref:Uncharacterized protein n=1 Tax=Tanacetum coccineum TaxID=301880 RepID=A0ABQ5HU85_9ASTR
MAYTSSGSSSSSDSEVDSYSKSCVKAYATLKEQYDSLSSDYKRYQFNLVSCKACLESVEARLTHYKKNETVLEEKINVLNLEVKLRDNAFVENQKKLEKSEKERDELKLTLEKFQNSSKSLNNLLESQVCDKFKTGLGYNVDANFYAASLLELYSFKLILNIMDEIVKSQHIAKGSTRKKGVIDSGCSRHMTRNKCYLTKYEDYDGGFVSFGDGKGGGDIVERAITTDASLVAAQDSDNIIRTQTTAMPNVDIPQGMDTSGKGHTSRSGDGRMAYTFELMDIVPLTPHDSPLPRGCLTWRKRGIAQAVGDPQLENILKTEEVKHLLPKKGNIQEVEFFVMIWHEGGASKEGGKVTRTTLMFQRLWILIDLIDDMGINVEERQLFKNAQFKKLKHGCLLSETTQKKIHEFRDTLIQHMESVKKSIDERAQHKREYDSWVNERQIQTTEDKVDTGKAVDASLVNTESIGTESKEQDTSSRSGNDAHADDADIRPIYDEEPMVEVQTTAEINIFATGQQHTEQPEFNNEGKVDQNVEQCHDTCHCQLKFTDNQNN